MLFTDLDKYLCFLAKVCESPPEAPSDTTYGRGKRSVTVLSSGKIFDSRCPGQTKKGQLNGKGCSSDKAREKHDIIMSQHKILDDNRTRAIYDITPNVQMANSHVALFMTFTQDVSIDDIELAAGTVSF